MAGRFKFTLYVDILEDASMVADPKVYEDGSPAQEFLRQSLNKVFLGANVPGTMVVKSTGIEYEVEKRKLDDLEIALLALEVHSDGPVRLPDEAHEDDTLERLKAWHPDVHVAERTELDGVLIHR